MSVIVRDMDKPKSCGGCPFVKNMDGFIICTRLGMNVEGKPLYAFKELCPISDLPPHDDLIEAKPIKDFITRGLNNKTFGYDQILVLAELEYAPVIVPKDPIIVPKDKEDRT